jgi:hypothetical protein
LAGEPHGSPASPLLWRAAFPRVPGLPAGKAGLRPQRIPIPPWGFDLGGAARFTPGSWAAARPRGPGVSTRARRAEGGWRTSASRDR